MDHTESIVLYFYVPLPAVNLLMPYSRAVLLRICHTICHMLKTCTIFLFHTDFLMLILTSALTQTPAHYEQTLFSSVFLFSSVSLGHLFLEPVYQRSSMLLALNRLLIGHVLANCVRDVRSLGRQGY